MRLDRIVIDRLPGITDAFTLDALDPGVNVILGPNATGKTSLCHAVRALLWPPNDGAPDTTAETAWSSDAGLLAARLEFGRTAWRRDGAVVERPQLPPRHLAHCFTITIEELLDESADASLAHQVAVEMAGGFDLGATLARPEFADQSRGGRRERGALETARRVVGEKQRGHEEIQAREDSRRRLVAERDAAAAARDRLSLLTAARELADARDELAAAEATLAGFPAGMDRLRGNEAKALAELDHDLTVAAARRDQSAVGAAEAVRERDAARFPGDPPDDAAILEMQDRARQLESIERDLRQADAGRREAETLRRAAATTLGGAPEVEIDPSALADLDVFLDEAQRLHRERNDLRARLDRLGEPPTGGDDLDRLREAEFSLRRWITISTTAGNGAGRGPLILLAIIALVGAVLTALRVHEAGWALVALVILAGAWLLRASTTNNPAARRRAIEEEHRRSGLVPPDAWTDADVAAALASLEARIVAALAEARRTVERETAAADLAALDEPSRRIEQRRSELATALGVDPETGDMTKTVLGGRLLEYLAHDATLAAATIQCRHLEEERADTLDTINRFLANHDRTATPDATAAVAALDDIERRVRRLRDAQSALDAAERSERDAREEIDLKTARRDEITAAAGLASSDDGELDRRLERLDEWKAAVLTEAEARHLVSKLERKLADAPDLLAANLESIDHWIRDAKDADTAYDNLVKEISAIDTVVAQARAGRDLETAIDEQQRAEDDLARGLESALDAASARFLLEEVRRAHETEGQPNVVQRAADLFGGFTRHEFELKVSATESGTRTFQALDTRAERRRELDQLSTGTRMQLLLAVRLAFAESAETAETLPIFLDEALGSADPDRYREATESLLALAGAGRQFFYLTCEPEHAARWRDAASAAGVPARIIDLAEARGNAGADVPTARYRPPAPAALPDPSTHTPESFARAVGVPAFNPRRPVASMHPYYLLQDDLALLGRLLRHRINAVGPLLGMLDAAGDRAPMAAADADRVRRRAGVAEAFIRGWRVGRGRPADRSSLVRSGAVSDKFIDGFAELLTERGHDAVTLLEEIRRAPTERDDRVKGFLEKKREALERFFVDEGFIDRQPVLDREGLVNHVVRSLRSIDDASSYDEIASLCGALWSACHDGDHISEPKPDGELSPVVSEGTTEGTE